jgi:RNA polymerase sigma factor (sigma-70 family)
MARGLLHALLDHFRRTTQPPAAEPLSDRQLLHRFADGRDEAAFAVLVQRHGPLVWGVCRRALQHTQDAEDVFQAAFLVLARKAATIRWQNDISPWLHAVAGRLAAEARAQRARRRDHEQQAAQLPRPESVPESTWREVCAALDDELQRLPADYRHPLLLCYFEGQTRDQAAHRLGWSLRTLERRLARAKELLRARLTARGVSLPTALLVAGLAQGTAPAGAPAALVAATVHAASAAAGALAGLISAQAAELAEGAVKGLTMTTTRLKLALLLLLAVGLLTAGASLATRDSPAGPQPGPKPKAPPQARTNAAGAALPRWAIARLGGGAFRHDSSIVPLTLAVSPDGKVIATATDNNGARHIHLWEAATGKQLARFDCGDGSPNDLAFARDGKTLASAQAYAVRLWEVPSGKLLREFSAEGHRATAVAFSWDGKRIASGGLDWPNPQLSDAEWQAMLKTNDPGLRKRYQVSQKTESAVHFWDLASGKELRRLSAGNHHGVTCLAILPGDKSVLTGHTDQALCLHEVVTGGLRYEQTLLPGYSGHMHFTLAPDGKSLITARATTQAPGRHLVLLDAATGRHLKRFLLRADAEIYAAFRPDGKAVLSVATEGSVRLLDFLSGKELRCFHSRPEDALGVEHFLADGKTCLARDGALLRLWDTVTGRELFPSTGHRSRIWALAFRPDGRTLVSISYQTLIVSAADNGKELARFHGATGSVSPPPFALAPDGRTVAAMDSGFFDAKPGPKNIVRIWDTLTGKELHRWPEDESWTLLALSADGNKVVTAPSYGGQDTAFRVRDAAAGKLLLAVKEKWEEWGSRRNRIPRRTNRVVFSADGRFLATAGSNVPSRLREAATGRLLWEDPLHNVEVLAFSPDSKLLALPGAEGSIRLLDVRTGKERLAFGKADHHPTSLAFSPDGTRLVSGSVERTICVWDVATGKEVRCLRGHQGPVQCVAFSPDGRRLATGSEDATVLTWEVGNLSAAPPRKSEIRNSKSE